MLQQRSSVRRRTVAAAAAFVLAAAISACGSTDTTSPKPDQNGSGADLVWRICDPSFTGWFAVQDGDAEWTGVTAATNGEFRFHLASNRGGVAYATVIGNSTNVRLLFASREFLSGPVSGCTTTSPPTRTVSGTITGSEFIDGFVGIGFRQVAVHANDHGSFALSGVSNGPHDLLAGQVVTTSDGTRPTKLILRRDVTIGENGTLPVLDFDAGETFSPIAVPLTIENLGLDQAQVDVSLYTGNLSAGNGLFSQTFFRDVSSAASHRTIYRLPNAVLRSGDGQVVNISTPSGGSPRRAVSASLDTLSNPTIALGPPLGAPTVSVVATTPFVRVRAQLPRQTEYDDFLSASLSQSVVDTLTGVLRTKLVSISVTHDWLGDRAFDVVIPDFSKLAGWDNTWGFDKRAAIRWSLTGQGNFPAYSWSAGFTGTITP